MGEGFKTKPKTDMNHTPDDPDGRFSQISSPSHTSMGGRGIFATSSFPESVTNPFSIASAMSGRASVDYDRRILSSPSRSHSDSDDVEQSISLGSDQYVSGKSLFY